MKLKVNVEYDTDCKTIEEAQEELSNRFAVENITAETEFWENMELEADKVKND